MNKRQVIILWVIAIALGAAVTAVKLNQDTAIHSATKRAAGETLFAEFPAEKVAAIDISGPDHAVHLAKKDGKWVVADRGDFPANATYVNNLLRTLGELKVTQGMQAGPSFAPRFGMDETAKKPEDHGLVAVFKDDAGKEVAKVALGKNIESGGASPNPMMGGGSVGRYVRNYADESGFYAVGEMFPSVSADPARWLDEDFISPEKIETIAVSEPGKTDEAWKLSRDGEDAEFKLAGATGDEVADTTKTSAMKSLFSYARFDDVVPADQVAEKIDASKKRTATIATFEGFTYHIDLTPEKAAEKPKDPVVAGASPPDEKYLVTVTVDAELPKERKKEEGEKPEDAAAKDKAFTERLKTLTDKLAKEKSFAGVTFELAKSQVEPLLHERKDLVTKAKPAEAGEPGGAAQTLPGGVLVPPPSIAAPPHTDDGPAANPAKPPVTATTPPIEAVTPPIQIPPSDEEMPADEDKAPEKSEKAPAKAEEAPAKDEEAPAKAEEAPAKAEDP